jgi:hypothetical protein
LSTSQRRHSSNIRMRQVQPGLAAIFRFRFTSLDPRRQTMPDPSRADRSDEPHQGCLSVP